MRRRSFRSAGLGAIIFSGMRCEDCLIASSSRPAIVVYESRTAVAYLDPDPAFFGHTLLVPRAHVASILSPPDGAAGSFFAALVEVVEQVERTLRPDGLEVGWSQSASAAAGGAHLRVRIVPAFRDGDSRARALGEGVTRPLLAELAERMRGGRVDVLRAQASRWVPRRMAALAEGEDSG